MLNAHLEVTCGFLAKRSRLLWYFAQSQIALVDVKTPWGFLKVCVFHLSKWWSDGSDFRIDEIFQKRDFSWAECRRVGYALRLGRRDAVNLRANQGYIWVNLRYLATTISVWLSPEYIQVNRAVYNYLRISGRTMYMVLGLYGQRPMYQGMAGQYISRGAIWLYSKNILSRTQIYR